MPRYFIAVEPPDDQRILIAAAMRQLGDPWPVPHITVKSPLGLSPDLKWTSRVRLVAAQVAPFIVKIGPPGTFGNRVLYLSVAGSGLVELHRRVLEAFSPVAGLDAEREFIPHLTLSISRNEQGLPPFQESVSPLQNLDPFEVSDLTVFGREDSSSHYRSWIRLPLSK
jgi:2'-5' RNA ligase